MKKYLIETNRMGMRLLEASDVIYLYPLESDPEVKIFFPDGARDRFKTEDMIKRFMTSYEEKNFLVFYSLIFNQMNLLVVQVLASPNQVKQRSVMPCIKNFGAGVMLLKR